MQARVEKRDHLNLYIWHYPGIALERGADYIIIEAHMSRDVPTAYVHFRSGDRMVETFYTDRWYNIMQMHDVDDDRLKGWYCNITRPAVISETPEGVTVAYADMALDAFISPVGDVLVLDEDELAALQLSVSDLECVWAALVQLRAQVARRENPFDKIAQR